MAKSLGSAISVLFSALCKRCATTIQLLEVNYILQKNQDDMTIVDSRGILMNGRTQQGHNTYVSKLLWKCHSISNAFRGSSATSLNASESAKQLIPDILNMHKWGKTLINSLVWQLAFYSRYSTISFSRQRKQDNSTWVLIGLFPILYDTEIVRRGMMVIVS